METFVSADSFKFVWYLWTISAINFPKKSSRLYLLYSVAFNFSILFYYSFSLLLALFYVENLKTLILNLVITSTIVACNIKYAIAFIRFNTLRSLIYSLGELDEFLLTKDQKRHLSRTIKKAHRLCAFVALEYGLIWLTSGLSMLISVQRGTLFYPAKYPVDWRTSKTALRFLGFYQFLGITMEILVNLADDLYPALLLFMLKGHYEILDIALQNIRNGGENQLTRNYRDLVKCIQYHQKIEKIFNAVAASISLPFFIQFLTTGIVLCLVGVIIIFFHITTVELAYLILYFFGIMLETLIPCFIGNELMYESDRLTTNLFSSNWVDQDAKFKQVLIIFMQNTQKSKVVRAGGFVPVTVKTFLDVTKSSYSLFAVFSELQN